MIGSDGSTYPTDVQISHFVRFYQTAVLKKHNTNYLIIFQTRFMKKRDNKTAVIVGTVTDDLRLLKVPKLKVCNTKR